MACLVAAHGDPLELLEFAEEVFDKMARFEQGFIERASVEAVFALGTVHNPVHIESLIGKKAPKIRQLNKGATPTVL
ncbi:hypothetical protein AA0242T_0995 [Acetobacter aceti NRIC 0242]|uniref:Uncharacterized protein n=1 Tax=Acetobacter aceti NBRC 14818 TaxID=887700 RepID=A0AB33IHW9_ACEAC|nr:hypothetical protein EDC15_102272 [Acetobacter aceti NBRC 14818]BCK77653.1 hypothetical protein EMQ_3259 [Acetobacter aceti NBRC 14818]GAN55869.1 hypothetical protein Abac_002_018 [Acetobacter aceti NBRC 14818]GBO80293.1 hypothetical protein AA0242T_0995 [Acetobacter aceti NRIC 0242]